MKNNKGMTLVILVIIIVVLVAIAGVAIYFVTGDDGVVSNAVKMEEETTRGEVRDHFLSLINEELVAVSAIINNTKDDISSKFNEPNLINFLNGNKNFEGENAEKETIDCLDEYQPASGESITVKTIIPKAGAERSDIQVKNIYRVDSSKLCKEGNIYGTGKTIKEGNIFTLEAITESQKNEDGAETGELLSTGQFELKYYDRNGKATVLETVSLYLTKQS